ncbi:hypothetical protein EON77_16485 [bacterium]|nr:MAG: hypothetical protein EON77_16485 [bacterium]
MDPERPKTKMTPIAATVAIVGIVGAVGLWARGAPAEVPLKIEPATSVGSKAPATSTPARLLVQIAGAVRKPGVYPLERDTRVGEAIRQAGGPTATAAVERLNLAAPLHDGEKLTVPEQSVGWGGSVETASEGGNGPIGNPELLAPMPVVVQTSGPIGGRTPRKSRARRKSVRESGGARPKAVASASKSVGSGERPYVAPPRAMPDSDARELMPDSISINSDPPEVLAKLPGINLALAREIVAERERRGGFRTFEELLDVRGIGPAKFEKIEPYLNLAVR